MFVLSVTIVVTSLSVTAYALPSFGENCLSCHQSGITISTNATRAVRVGANASFWLEVNASGGNPRHMMITWSNVSHNTYFSFRPSYVEDNDPNDRQSDGGKITALFKISTPNVEGNYTIRTYAASTEGKGGFVEVIVTVGKGGEIRKPLLETMMELLTTFAPKVLAGIAILGIALYVVAWRRIPRGAYSW